MKKETVSKILSETEKGYNLISGKFSQTRKRFWDELDFIGDYAETGKRVLDFGCGNGRLLELIGKKDVEYVGLDASEELINLANDKYSGEGINFLKIDFILFIRLF